MPCTPVLMIFVVIVGISVCLIRHASDDPEVLTGLLLNSQRSPSAVSLDAHWDEGRWKPVDCNFCHERSLAGPTCPRSEQWSVDGQVHAGKIESLFGSTSTMASTTNQGCQSGKLQILMNTLCRLSFQQPFRLYLSMLTLLMLAGT